MRILRQHVRLSELLSEVSRIASAVHVSLALTVDESKNTTWLARVLIVDVFPNVWFDDAHQMLPETMPITYAPPDILKEYPGQALFLCRFLPTEQVIKWLSHPNECELTRFDSRPGQGSQVLQFALPEFHLPPQGIRVYSGHTDGFALLPWPHTVFRCSFQNPPATPNSDFQELYAADQTPFDNLKEAVAKLMYRTTLRQYPQVETDVLALRLIDADGWICQATFATNQVEVAVAGTHLSRGRLILKGEGIDDIERPCVEPQVLTIPLSGPAPADLNVVLANEEGVLDRAWRPQATWPFDPTPRHVVDLIAPVPGMLAIQRGIQSVTPIAQGSLLPPQTTQAAVEDTAPSTPSRQSDPATTPNKGKHHTMKQNKQVSVLRVVVASPGDVAKERAAVSRVLTELNRHMAADLGVRLEEWTWEVDAYPGLHAHGPQGKVDESMDIETADVVIGIFWKRFGTPVNDAQSGTEHELRRAMTSWKNTGHPHVMMYFKTQAVFPKTSAEVSQLAAVIRFKEEVQTAGLVSQYKGTPQFENKLREHLQHWLRDAFGQSPVDTSAPEIRAAGAPVATAETPLSPAQIILRHLVGTYEPEAAVTSQDVSKVTALEGRTLSDALHQLGDAGAIKPLGNPAHRYTAFQVLPAAWEQVDQEVLGFSLQEDMLTVAEAASDHDQIDRDALLRATNLPEHRLDIAALLLDAHGHMRLYRPVVRGLTFRAAMSDHKTRQFVREHKQEPNG